MRSATELRDEAAEEFKRGDLVYFWNGGSWTPYKFMRYHGYRDATSIVNSDGDRIVRRCELIGEGRYLAEKTADRKAKALIRYTTLIEHWQSGLRKSREIAPLIGETPRATGQMIAAAIGWGFIIDDRKPSKANSIEGSGSAE